MSALALLIITPWSIRNAIQMDSPIVLSANFGYNLRAGHAPYATGRYIVPQDLWNDEPGLTFAEREVFFNDQGRDRALGYALGHPGHELKLAGRKIMWLWRPDSDVLNWVTNFGNDPLPGGAQEPLRLLVDATYLATLALLPAGLFLSSARPRAPAFVLALLGLWTAMHVVFFGEPRFHLPVLVVIIPAAAGAIVSFVAHIAVPLRRSASS